MTVPSMTKLVFQQTERLSNSTFIFEFNKNESIEMNRSNTRYNVTRMHYLWIVLSSWLSDDYGRLYLLYL